MAKKRFYQDFQNDFSNRTVVIMLVVVVVISALSLGFYLHTLNTLTLADVDQQPEQPSNLGSVTLQIVEPPPEERRTNEQKGAGE